MTAKAASFVEIYTAYARDVYRFALYLSGDAAAAQDITSETFCRVWLTSQPVRMATVKAWLFVIARNLYRQELRHVRRRESLDPEMASGMSMAADAELKDECGRVCRALALLPEVDRSAVLMRVEGVSYEEIAAELGISLGAAKVKVHRARLQLAKSNPGGIGHERFEKRHS
jgi:RNA polymerase sigma-70 factor, ECF subfamily